VADTQTTADLHAKGGAFSILPPSLVTQSPRLSLMDQRAALTTEQEAQQLRRLRATFETTYIGIAHLDAAENWLDINQHLCGLLMRSAEELRAVAVRDIIHPADLGNDREEYRRLLAGGLSSYTSYKRLLRSDGSAFRARIKVTACRHDTGALDFMVIAVEDISEEDRAAAQLVVQRQRLQQALRAGRLAVHEYEPLTGRVVWDEAGRRMWGLPAGMEPSYEFFMERVHPDDRAQVQREVAIALDPAGPPRYECIYRFVPLGSDEVRWAQADGDVTFAGDVAVLLVGTMRDVTEERVLAETNQLLLGELVHRIKNTLAVVAAMASQTFRGSDDLEAMKERFASRLKAMGFALDDLSAGHWRSADLWALLSRVIGCCIDIERRVRHEGPPVAVPAPFVQPLCLVFHELSTNALKYGALSVDEGRVQLTWKHNPEGLVELEWREVGGPHVEAPRRRGFGSQLIVRAMPAIGGAGAAIEYLPDGVVCRLRYPRTLPAGHDRTAPALIA